MYRKCVATKQMRYYRLASLREKMLIMDKKSNENKIFKMFSQKAKEHTESKEIKANIDIFYELFWLNELTQIFNLIL